MMETEKLYRDADISFQSIAAVAFDVGINTIVAFYNAFKKYTNLTPAQYKKEVNNKK